jgi:anti-sigma factor RsiW
MRADESDREMRHLTPIEIGDWAENASATSEARAHLTTCHSCQARILRAQRMERALQGLGRAEPAADLSARIIAQLAHRSRANAPVWLGLLTLAVALLSFGLAYQTAFDLQTNGAFELVAVYSSQPQILTTYPGAAWDAFVSAIPWATLVAAGAALCAAMVLVYRFAGRNLILARAR